MTKHRFKWNIVITVLWWTTHTTPLQFLCATVSVAHLINQRKKVFWGGATGANN